MISKFSILPSFAAFRSDRTLYPHIARAFLKDIEVQEADMVHGSLILEDGTDWTIVLDEQAAEIIHSKGECYCICSFQLWRDGQKYAVCKANKVYYKRLQEQA